MANFQIWERGREFESPHPDHIYVVEGCRRSGHGDTGGESHPQTKGFRSTSNGTGRREGRRSGECDPLDRHDLVVGRNRPDGHRLARPDGVHPPARIQRDGDVGDEFGVVDGRGEHEVASRD